MPRTRARGAAVSSAILYLAIVAIWAIVLVPRWLRPPQYSGTLESNLAEPVAASPLEDVAEAEEDAGDAAGGESLSAPGAQSADAQAAVGRLARPAAAERRERVMQARRRMLVTLTVITAGSVVVAVAHLAAAWVVIPPAVMLAGFVLLLHEAARIDTERVWAAARRPALGAGADTAAAGGPGRQQAGPADSAQPGVASAQPGVAGSQPGAPGPQAGVASAEIIDISGRIGDQLYDQYADAEVRAVGD
jgi:hypothetical protein